MLNDHHWMQRALALATTGATLASPNPTVGCVLVREGEIAGEGFHNYDLRDHAEIAALKQAGPAARGATAYVTLEPCSHHGRTGPCDDALIQAGVFRVVIATRDPNPLVSGTGITRLRAAGVAVTENLMRGQARDLNLAFAKSITTGLPFVTLKSATSQDGKIAPAPGTLPAGQRLHLTGPEANQRVQEMRAHSDALLTGAGTILADDPLLTDRSGLPRRRPLLRVVVDSSLRTPPTSRLAQSAGGEVLVFHTGRNEAAARDLRAAGVETEILPEVDGRVSLSAALHALSRRKITSVLLEAGPNLNTAMLNAGLVDALAIFQTSQWLGENAVPAVLPGASRWPGLAGEGKLPLPGGGSAQIREEHLGADHLYFSVLTDPWPA